MTRKGGKGYEEEEGEGRKKRRERGVVVDKDICMESTSFYLLSPPPSSFPRDERSAHFRFSSLHVQPQPVSQLAGRGWCLAVLAVAAAQFEKEWLGASPSVRAGNVVNSVRLSKPRPNKLALI